MTTSPTSRYRDLPPYQAPGADGSVHATVPARLVPAMSDGTPYLHTVLAGETVESLAYRYLGSSTAWWQIADANPAVFPAVLVPGTVLAIPTGRTQGATVRTRSF